MRIVTLGDLLLDVVVRVERPLVRGDDVVAVTQTGPGGQAANVAAWAAELGASAAFVGRRGDDDAGRLVSEALTAYGVELLGPAAGRNGVVVSLVDPDGLRSMASDRGVAPELREEDLDPTWLDGCDWLHVAGYSLLREPIAGASLRAAGLARTAGARVSVDLSTSSAIEELGPARFLSLLEGIRPDLLFGTAGELEALGGEFPSPHWVLKRGAAGIAVGTDGSVEELPATAADVVDTTGAGDAIAAGFLVGGPEVALAAAARCVAKMGAMP
jgi:sugar/nucleoside kinase (ribokinase family)